MNISSRVTEVLNKKEPCILNSDNATKCIEFTKKMKSLGILRSNLEQNTNGDTNQLKLYVISKIIV